MNPWIWSRPTRRGLAIARWAALACVVAFLGFFRASAAPVETRYLPTIVDNRAFTATISGPPRIEHVADVEMPFNAYGAVQVDPVQTADGWWYFVVFRIGDSRTGEYSVRWKEGERVQVLDGPSTQAVEPIDPGTAQADGRASQACAYDGSSIYRFAWHSAGRRSPVLRVTEIVNVERCQ